jgi:hypothetical protein
MKRPCLIVTAIAVAGLLAMPAHASQQAVRQTFPGRVPPSQKQVVTIASYLPWYAVPDRYLFSGGYYMHLSITEMRIDHVADESRCTRGNRTFMIAAAFSQPIGNRLGSGRYELPLFSADRFAVSRLSHASVGDYVLHFSDAPLYHAALGLALTARF